MASFHRSAFILLFVAAGCATSEPDDPGGVATRCGRVRDHLIALQLDGAPGVDRAAHRDALQAALGTDFAARCADALSAAQIDCVLSAHDPTSAAACTAGGVP